MRASREPSIARRIHPPSPRRRIRRPTVIAISLTVAVAGIWVDGPAAVAHAAPGSQSTATPHPVRPSIHNVSIPNVAPVDRERVAERSGSRAALAATSVGATIRGAGAAVLVAHVRTSVSQGSSMLGVTWRHGSVDPSKVFVVVRTRLGSAWSPWSAVDVDADGSSAAEDDTVRDGTVPVFVGAARSVEVDVYSTTRRPPSELSIAEIDPGSSAYDERLAALSRTSDAANRTATSGGATTTAAASVRDPYPQMPQIVTRREWGADESLGDKCWAPRYGRTFKVVFVHHTAGSNTYTRQESPAIVRGILAYHTQTRGWCDIGYNFLVDRYGTVYQGRAGGIRQAVRGAHAGDYNVDSTGISLMGEFTSEMPTRAMRRSLVALTAWRLGVAYHGGYGKGRINGHAFKRISGHRDAMSTACPGQRVYDWLPTLRSRVQARLDHFMSPLKRRWIAMGGFGSRLGPVRVGEVRDNGGMHTTFVNARAYFKHGVLRSLPAGPLLSSYVRSGETNGPLGYPTTRQLSPLNGAAAKFEHGALYWSPATQSRLLKGGKVLHRYRSLNGPNGPLGFPKTHFRNTKVSRFVRFQHGTITYDKSTGRVAVTYT
jgi:hypothetical protein